MLVLDNEKKIMTLLRCPVKPVSLCLNFSSLVAGSEEEDYISFEFKGLRFREWRGQILFLMSLG